MTVKLYRVVKNQYKQVDLSELQSLVGSEIQSFDDFICLETAAKGRMRYEMRTHANIFGGTRAGENRKEMEVYDSLGDWKSHKKTYLPIGDSIRRRYGCAGYCKPLYHKLKDSYNIFHIPHNTSNSRLVVRCIDSWLGASNPDIISINAGLHDLKKVGPNSKSSDGTPNVSIEDYEDNFEKIINTINSHSKNISLYLVANTPVIEKFCSSRTRRYNKNVIEYNSVLKSLSSKYDLPYIDLYEPLYENLEKYISTDGVHLTPAGEKECAALIHKSIILGEKEDNHND